MFKLIYLDKRLHKIFANSSDPLDRVRARFLINALIASLFIVLITLPGFYINSFDLLFFRSILICIFQLGLIWLLLSTPKWKVVAHAACLLLVFLIISNIFVFVQGVKVLSLQFMLLLIVMSYYLLGSKWGTFYSFLSASFMVFYFLVFGKNAMALIEKQDVDNFTFIVVFLFNFLLLIYVQYHFFGAFNNTIKKLEDKQKEEALLNEKLRTAIKTSERLSKAKTDFLSTISHELRTPLNGVIGMSDVLILDNPREDQKENLNILKFSANNLMHLINDVLDINKIESGKIEMEKIPFKIDDLLNNIYRGFRDRAKSKDLEFNLTIDQGLGKIYIIGDQTRLTQILNNLIENALKFTKEGTVDISIKIEEKTTTNIKLLFSIRDTGIGIPKDKQELIFESFSQASTSTTRNFGGTGLGLTIVKNLLELHHSTITTKSELNVGTSFSFHIVYQWIDLNIETKKEIEPIIKTMQDADISNLKILIAEDNQMNILLMRKLLAKWNISPDFALNGAEALEAFKARDYDLILMDIHMPVMDGYEASSLIRKYTNHQKASIPIIALTASVATDIKSKIADAGINGFISKPFNPDELREKLEDIATKMN